MIELDKLDKIFVKQKEYEMMLNLQHSQEERIKSISMAIHAEASELLNTTSWKWWKKRHQWNPEFAFEELVDILHFIISGCLALDKNSENLFEEYLKKNQINRNRQNEGY